MTNGTKDVDLLLHGLDIPGKPGIQHELDTEIANAKQREELRQNLRKVLPERLSALNEATEIHYTPPKLSDTSEERSKGGIIAFLKQSENEQDDPEILLELPYPDALNLWNTVREGNFSKKERVYTQAIEHPVDFNIEEEQANRLLTALNEGLVYQPHYSKQT